MQYSYSPSIIKITNSEFSATVAINVDDISTLDSFLIADNLGMRVYNRVTSEHYSKGWYEVWEVTPVTTPKTYYWHQIQEAGGDVPVVTQDLDNIVETGSYYINGGTHTPVTNAKGTLNHVTDGTHSTQTFTTISDEPSENGKVYVRTTQDGLTWSDWIDISASSIQLVAQSKVGPVATWTYPDYFSSDDDYLVYVHCSDMTKSIVSKEIDGNKVIVTFNDDIESDTCILRLEKQTV